VGDASKSAPGMVMVEIVRRNKKKHGGTTPLKKFPGIDNPTEATIKKEKRGNTVESTLREKKKGGYPWAGTIKRENRGPTSIPLEQNLRVVASLKKEKKRKRKKHTGSPAAQRGGQKLTVPGRNRPVGKRSALQPQHPRLAPKKKKKEIEAARP